MNEKARQHLKDQGYVSPRLLWEALISNKDIEGALTMLRNIIIKTATELCGTVVVGRNSGDAWWNDEIEAARQEKKEAYKRTLNITGLNDEERNSLKNDYRHENKKVKRLVKESKYTLRTEEERKIQNDFEGGKKLIFKKMEEIKVQSL